jgi:pimeloyl-ACP methyl ester carboxylesterase
VSIDTGETQRLEMNVRESGSPGASAVVFLHGVGNSGGMWGRHMAQLKELHCLAPDLPGFGRSNHLAWTTREDITDTIAALIQTRIPDQKAHVVGLPWVDRSLTRCWRDTPIFWTGW